MMTSIRRFVVFTIVILSLQIFCCSCANKEDAATAETPNYEILRTSDVSHAAAARITVYIRLNSNCTKDEIQQIIVHATKKFISQYDIVWLEIQSHDPGNPVLCKTKWISSSLDEQWHTTGDGFMAEEYFENIGIRWSQYYKKQGEIKTGLGITRKEVIVPFEQLGYTVIKRRPVDGQDQYIIVIKGSYQRFSQIRNPETTTFQVIGPENNVTFASALISFSTDPEENVPIISAFSKFIAIFGGGCASELEEQLINEYIFMLENPTIDWEISRSCNNKIFWAYHFAHATMVGLTIRPSS